MFTSDSRVEPLPPNGVWTLKTPQTGVLMLLKIASGLLRSPATSLTDLYFFVRSWALAEFTSRVRARSVNLLPGNWARAARVALPCLLVVLVMRMACDILYYVMFDG